MRAAAIVLVCLLVATSAGAQVTTATFYGIVADGSGAALPGATVTLRHEGTSATVTKATDGNGEFAFNFMPVGLYTLRIELAGFKTYESREIELGAAQNVRRTYTLELGNLEETLTVTGDITLVNTVAPEQRESYSRVEVTELPLARRNFSNILQIGTGVTPGSEGGFRLNGLGRSGTKVTVDGTDASGNSTIQNTLGLYRADGNGVDSVGGNVTGALLDGRAEISLGGIMRSLDVADRADRLEGPGRRIGQLAVGEGETGVVQRRLGFGRIRVGAVEDQVLGSGGRPLAVHLPAFGLPEEHLGKQAARVEGVEELARIANELLDRTFL